MATVQVLEIVTPVFGLILLGFLLRQIGFLSEREVGALVKVVYYLALPMTVFAAITSSDFNQVVHGPSLAGLALSLFTFGLAAFLVLGMMGMSLGIRAVTVISSIRGNMAFVALPIIFNAWGRLALAKGGLILGVLIAPISVATVILFRVAGGAEQPGLKTVLRAFWDPIVVAAFLGIVVSWREVAVPEILGEMVEMLAEMALPSALLAIGASFTPEILVSRATPTAVAIAGKLLLLPLWGFFVLHYLLGLPLDSLDLQVSVMILTSPASISIYVVARQFLAAQAPVAGTTIALSTALATLTMTGWLALLIALG
ncbi:MAG: AEC family transporter [Thermoleophilia bacterium]